MSTPSLLDKVTSAESRPRMSATLPLMSPTVVCNPRETVITEANGGTKSAGVMIVTTGSCKKVESL